MCAERLFSCKYNFKNVTNRGTMFDAIEGDDLQSILQLISKGANIEENGNTLLTFAASKGNKEILRVLLENKASFEAQRL